MNEFLINVDWLQMHVKTHEDFITREQPFFVFERSGQSKVWGNIYTIKNSVTKKSIATYCTDAQKCIMPENEGVLKIENWFLYTYSDLRLAVEDLLRKLQFTFENITRFDIAFDFQKFYQNISPETFINGCVRSKYIRSIAGNFAAFGKQKDAELRFETFQWGSKRSNIMMKLYNKTKELDVHCKPYISGLHKQTFTTSKSDVWRLEFSIGSLKNYFKSANEMKERKKEIDFNSLQVLDIDVYYGMYQGLFERYFDFRTKKKLTSKEKKEIRKSERVGRMKKNTFWIFDDDILKLQSHSRGLKRTLETVLQSSRSEKQFIKKLAWFCGLLGNFDKELSVCAKQILWKVIVLHGLQDWAESKGIIFTEKEMYVESIEETANIIARKKEMEFYLNEKAKNQKIKISDFISLDKILKPQIELDNKFQVAMEEKSKWENSH